MRALRSGKIWFADKRLLLMFNLERLAKLSLWIVFGIAVYQIALQYGFNLRTQLVLKCWHSML